MSRQIAVLVGSLRNGSFSRQIADALIQLAPEGVELKIVEIGDLPLYNQDLDANPPEAWTRFKDRIQSADAVLFVTPEYNRSIPGGLKTPSIGPAGLTGRTPSHASRRP